MPMGREYFCAYHSYLESLRNLTDAECGRLFRALLHYSATGESSLLGDRENIAFDFMSSQIDRDRAAYERKREKLRENGLKAIATNCPQMPPEAGQGKGKGEGEGEGKGKGKEKGDSIMSERKSKKPRGALTEVKPGEDELAMLRRVNG